MGFVLNYLRQRYLQMCIEVAAEEDEPDLDLSESYISEFPNVRLGACIERLFLQKNSLTTFPAQIVQLRALSALFLDYNKIERLPPEIGDLKGLVTLNISYNPLGNLAPEIGLLENLEELWCNGIGMEDLPPEIGNLTNLKTLGARGNLLIFLPDELCNLKNLQWLTLENNHLNHLPKCMDGLQSLVHLNVRGNRLSSIPSGLIRCPLLQHMQFSDNYIYGLPNDFLVTKMQSLQLIDLGGNPVIDNECYVNVLKYQQEGSDENQAEGEAKTDTEGGSEPGTSPKVDPLVLSGQCACPLDQSPSDVKSEDKPNLVQPIQNTPETDVAAVSQSRTVLSEDDAFRNDITNTPSDGIAAEDPHNNEIPGTSYAFRQMTFKTETDAIELNAHEVDVLDKDTSNAPGNNAHESDTGTEVILADTHKDVPGKYTSSFPQALGNKSHEKEIETDATLEDTHKVVVYDKDTPNALGNNSYGSKIETDVIGEHTHKLKDSDPHGSKTETNENREEIYKDDVPVKDISYILSNVSHGTKSDTEAIEQPTSDTHKNNSLSETVTDATANVPEKDTSKALVNDSHGSETVTDATANLPGKDSSNALENEGSRAVEATSPLETIIEEAPESDIPVECRIAMALAQYSPRYQAQRVAAAQVQREQDRDARVPNPDPEQADSEGSSEDDNESIASEDLDTEYKYDMEVIAPLEAIAEMIRECLQDFGPLFAGLSSYVTACP